MTVSEVSSRAAGRYVYGFSLGAYLERDRYGQDVFDTQLNRRLAVMFETGHIDFESVLAGNQVQYVIDAFRSRLGGDRDFVRMFVVLTAAPGTAPPVASVTWPVIRPVATWAFAEATANAVITKNFRRFICTSIVDSDPILQKRRLRLWV